VCACIYVYKIDLRARDQLEDLRADGRIILNWISRKWVEKVWTGFIVS